MVGAALEQTTIVFIFLLGSSLFLVSCFMLPSDCYEGFGDAFMLFLLSSSLNSS